MCVCLHVYGYFSLIRVRISRALLTSLSSSRRSDPGVPGARAQRDCGRGARCLPFLHRRQPWTTPGKACTSFTPVRICSRGTRRKSGCQCRCLLRFGSGNGTNPVTAGRIRGLRKCVNVAGVYGTDLTLRYFGGCFCTSMCGSAGAHTENMNTTNYKMHLKSDIIGINRRHLNILFKEILSK